MARRSFLSLSSERASKGSNSSPVVCLQGRGEGRGPRGTLRRRLPFLSLPSQHPPPKTILHLPSSFPFNSHHGRCSSRYQLLLRTPKEVSLGPRTRPSVVELTFFWSLSTAIFLSQILLPQQDPPPPHPTHVAFFLSHAFPHRIHHILLHPSSSRELRQLGFPPQTRLLHRLLSRPPSLLVLNLQSPRSRNGNRSRSSRGRQAWVPSHRRGRECGNARRCKGEGREGRTRSHVPPRRRSRA